jgi:hypothetical protein
MTSLIKNIVKCRKIDIVKSKRIDTPLNEVKDLSVTGLQISSITSAIMNHLKMGPSTHRSDPKLTPLGKWKVDVDNYSDGKSYGYDHSI